LRQDEIFRIKPECDVYRGLIFRRQRTRCERQTYNECESVQRFHCKSPYFNCYYKQGVSCTSRYLINIHLAYMEFVVKALA
jgi:hypothetical protein